MFHKLTGGKKEVRHESVHCTSIISEKEQTLLKYEQEFQKLQTESRFLRESPSRSVPKFGRNEIEVGPVLGIGGFCTVNEVVAINLDPSLSHLQPAFQVKDGAFHETETREYMSKYCLRVKSARYAIKRMKKNFDDEKAKCRGMLDLAIEAEYLSRLSHPNIVKMRGSLDCESNVKDEGFYIVLDRLYETLQQKIDIIWPKEYKIGPFGLIGKDKGKLRRMFLERMIVAHDLSSVFRYLHSKRIIYRDLKPENIGFDVRGDVKLFDFGLCKELPNISGHDGPSQIYKLTARTGSIPYMAPECMLGQKYNQYVDAFSFGMLLWEIFALKIPFKGFNRYDFIERVCKGPKLRPDGTIKCPPLTKGIMKECWDHDAKKRPDFNRISMVIRGEMNDMTEGLNASVRDRTTHLMNRSRNSMHSRNPSKILADKNT